jgi:hypothetical protein
MDILDNPFWILEATLRDNRRRIMELAEEKSLISDEVVIDSASSALTNPRKRLGAEISWMPGLGPKRVSELVAMLQSNPNEIPEQDGIPSLAKVNLLVSGLKSMSEKIGKDDLPEWIVRIAEAYDDVVPDEALSLINEEREVSGFPSVTDQHAFEAEIESRRQHFKAVIRDALNQLAPDDLVMVVTNVVEEVTEMGELAAPLLIDDLVDTYEVEAQAFLDKEESIIQGLTEKLRLAVDSGGSRSSLTPLVDQLIKVVRNWDSVAQPIQVSTKSRGLDHEGSHRVAAVVRDLAIHMFNKHDKLDFSQQLTNMLQEVFAEVGEVAERTAEDADSLSKIAVNRNKLFSQFSEFNLNSDTFSYKGKTHKTNDILHIGFYRAVTTHKTNFVEKGKTEEVNIYLTMTGGKKVSISIDEDGFLYNSDKSVQIKRIVEFYSYLSQVTLDRRVTFYESQIKRNGYFEYDKCHFYPHNKIVFRGRDFNLSSTSFLREYGLVEMRKKDFGFLDKIKREVSLTKIPQFSTITDTDVIFSLLDKHFSLRWKQ